MSNKSGLHSLAGAMPGYPDSLPLPHRDDAHGALGHLLQPAACPQCKAVFHKGHWHWQPPPPQALVRLCPACLRIRDDLAAGEVRLEGEFLSQHREAVLTRVREVAAAEMASQPLHRIMQVLDEPHAVLVTTTDVQLARHIGEAIRHAYQGQLEIRPGATENTVRVRWQR